MGFSKPIVASDVLAQKELLERSGSGLIHQAGDAESFAEKCFELYENESLRKKLGENGKRFLEEDYNLAKVGQSLLNCYTKLKENKLE